MSKLNVDLETAIKLCLQADRIPEIKYITLETAVDYIVAEDIIAEINMPGFVRSLVDGYALHRDNINLNSPIQKLRISGEIAAGQPATVPLSPGICFRVMTGAQVPDGTAAVLKQERAVLQQNYISYTDYVKDNENLQLIGDVITAGDKIAFAGSRLNPETLEQIACTGISHVPVFKKPRVYIIVTGTELDQPGQPLRTGHIYNSNRTLFSTLVSKAGGQPESSELAIGDDLPALMQEIKTAVHKAPLVIISGGTSDGQYDIVPNALEKLGARFLFRELDLRPAHRTSAAILDGSIVFNVTGNPFGGVIMFYALISPVFKWLQGMRNYANSWFDFYLENDLPRIIKVRRLMLGELTLSNNGFSIIPHTKMKTDINLPVLLDIPAGHGRVGDQARATLIHLTV